MTNTEPQYREILAGEILRDGDQVELVEGVWTATTCAGQPKPGGSRRHRRPIVPEFRELGPDEIIEAGDEYFDVIHGRWSKTHYAGKLVSEQGYAYRRPLIAKPEPQPAVTNSEKLLPFSGRELQIELLKRAIARGLANADRVADQWGDIVGANHRRMVELKRLEGKA